MYQPEVESRTQGSGQGHKKILRPRTDPLEGNAKDTDASVLQKKKKVFKKFFLSDLYLRKPKKSLCRFSVRFLAFSNGSRIVLSSSRGQGNFRRLEASRPRTSKCVLEGVLKAKDVLEDSTLGINMPAPYLNFCS